MTLFEQGAPESLEGRSVPVLETERLVLRPPRLEDAATIAVLVNDRRIAENTLRIPHPYALADAQAFLTTANATGGEIVFLITTWTAPCSAAAESASSTASIPRSAIGSAFRSGARVTPPRLRAL